MITVGRITHLTTDKGPLPKHIAALPPVRSEPLFGGKWTDSDLKAFATARCREIRRKYTREQAQSICEEMAQLWDLGNDYLTPNTQAEGRLTRKDNHE